MKYFLIVLQKYAVFTGRARRKEYWYFTLFSIIFSFVLGLIDGMLGLKIGNQGIISTLYSIFVLIPNIAVAIRRMHDVGKSGWFCLIPIYNIILAATAGDVGENKYGEDPKEPIEEFK